MTLKEMIRAKKREMLETELGILEWLKEKIDHRIKQKVAELKYWQDVDNTYTPEEQALDQRLDNKP
ncbi:hypothetical protein LCGC14_0960310 [marine sediment metagenome]|uniref:Uncharacterized protein n=1 Tax=marine sediment metagenome TaxID=412755 RepID=A0A0F9RL53_9ZZZZ